MRNYFLGAVSLCCALAPGIACADEPDDRVVAQAEHQQAVNYAESENIALVVPNDVGTLGASLEGSGYSLALGKAGSPGIEFIGRLCISRERQQALKICDTTAGGGTVEDFVVTKVGDSFIVSTQPFYEGDLEVGSDGTSLRRAFDYGWELFEDSSHLSGE